NQNTIAAVCIHYASEISHCGIPIAKVSEWLLRKGRVVNFNLVRRIEIAWVTSSFGIRGPYYSPMGKAQGIGDQKG
ncbi:2950_t:CDS:2, partial [Funneliformis mosseae]